VVDVVAVVDVAAVAAGGHASVRDAMYDDDEEEDEEDRDSDVDSW